MNTLYLPLMGIEAINIFIMIVLLLQFVRIHKKRVSLLHVFNFDGELEHVIHAERIQAVCILAIYITMTLLISIVAVSLFILRPHWL